MAATNGNAGNAAADDMAKRVPPGVIMPPPAQRNVIETTAAYIARNGMSFEQRLRDTRPDDAKLAFLQPDDAYHAFYRWRVDEIKAGRGVGAGAAPTSNGDVSFQGREVRKGPEKPDDFHFSARMPNISAQDLDVVKLTAMYAAKNGKQWTIALSQKEAANYQFDFLRPNHTLNPFFSRLVDQYTDLLTGDSIDAGRPQKKRIVQLEENVKDRSKVLERAKKRAEWVKHQQAQKVAKEEKDEREKVEYAQIDWHDFVVVETIVFDERDETADLPAPPTVNDLQSASLEQKAAMSINPNRRIEEGFPSFDDPSFYGQQPNPPQQQQYQSPAPPQAAAAAQMPPPQYHPTPPPAQQQQSYAPPADDSEPSRHNTLQADRERARAAQEAARAQPAMRIRNDYVPRAQARRAAQNTSLCPNCKNQIPNEEFAEHLRIEMLSPEWREQSARAAHRSSTTNLSTQEVANNLKRLASQRSDVFDPVTGQALSAEEAERRKRAERGAYDGVSTVPNPASLAAMQGALNGEAGADGQGQGQGQARDVQEQIRQIYERAGRS